MRAVLIILLLIVLAFAGFIVVARVTSVSVDGIPCNFSEGTGYHVHAHLVIVVDGKRHAPPGGVGIHTEHLCLYWVHTHDGSGIIHIEAPHHIKPTLGNFFDIWGQPLTRRQIASYVVHRGQSVRMYVGRERYSGNPRDIVLGFHTKVTLEVGPPFVPPPAVNFQGL